MMKTITLRLNESDYLALKNYASVKRISMTAVIMQQLDALGVTKPAALMQKNDASVDDLEFVEE
jgi:hypothetical protein